jgi:hypothetical protein
MHIFELSVSEWWVHMCVEKGSWGTHSFEVYQEGRPTQCLFFLHFHDVTQVASIHNKMAPKMAIINNNSLTSFYILDQLLKKWKNIYNLNPQNLAIKEAQNQRNLAGIWPRSVYFLVACTLGNLPLNLVMPRIFHLLVFSSLWQNLELQGFRFLPRYAHCLSLT